MTYLKSSIEEMELINQMSEPIQSASDFGSGITGITIFRACSMSLQYITENFIKIRNIASEDFFGSYTQVPWKAVFGLRNFLVHDYVEVDDEAVFSTIREDLPILKLTAKLILSDLESGKLDSYFTEKK